MRFVFRVARQVDFAVLVDDAPVLIDQNRGVVVVKFSICDRPFYLPQMKANAKLLRRVKEG